MKLLMTAIGKRVQLIKYLKRHFTIVGVDCSQLAPASFFVDGFFSVPSCSDEFYLEAILKICREQKIDVLLPLYEKEFYKLDSIRAELESNGTLLLLSEKRVLDICEDKWETYRFFKENNISTPQSWLEKPEGELVFPMFIKPRRGMGSYNAYAVNNMEDLNFYISRIKEPIIQELLTGTEYTMDCISDLEGRALSVVPRLRLEVRAGEVTKTRTVRDMEIINQTTDLLDKLGSIGPTTVQCFRAENGNISFTEINARVGGGVPLAIEAGIDYGGIFTELLVGRRPKLELGYFRELTMLRYDEAVFL